MLQRVLHEQCKAGIQSVRERLIKTVRPLDGGQLRERPAPNGWSVGEVLEHLCVSDELYMPKITALIAGARRDAGASNREWKPSLLGGFIAGALEKPRKVKAMKLFQPGPTPRNGVLEAFLAIQYSVLAAMDNASSVDWRAVRIGSVAMPSFAPKMNLGDAFRIHAVHGVRHAGQVERVVAALQR